jgi:hypothetical protein
MMTATAGRSAHTVLRKVQLWKQRRIPPLAEQDIVATIRDLAALGWIAVTRSTDLPLDEAVSVA